jgi:hypothetical protein
VLAGGNGITINDGATATPNTAVVVLRGLDIVGVNPPSNGVSFISGAALHIEDSAIRRFNAAGSFGISFQPAGTSRLYVTNTTITDNGSADGTGGGILIKPQGATGSAQVEMRDVRVLNNATVGMKVETNGNTAPAMTLVAVADSRFSGSPIGVSAIMPSGGSPVDVTIKNALINLNTSVGVAAVGSGSAIVRVSDSMITGNGRAVLSSGGGTVRSYGDNLTEGNVQASSFSGGVLPKN